MTLYKIGRICPRYRLRYRSLSESAPDIDYGAVLSRSMGPLSRVFAQSVVKRRATRSRPRSRHRRTHISYNVVVVLVKIGLLRDLFVVPFSLFFHSGKTFFPISPSNFGVLCVALSCPVRRCCFYALVPEWKKSEKAPSEEVADPVNHPNNGKERMNSSDCDMDVIWTKNA